jgi:hypothetical protein
MLSVSKAAEAPFRRSGDEHWHRPIVPRFLFYGVDDLALEEGAQGQSPSGRRAGGGDGGRQCSCGEARWGGPRLATNENGARAWKNRGG